VSRTLIETDLPRLCEQWIKKFADLCGEIPLRLVNHEIHLINPNKQCNYCLLKCADHYKEQLLLKIEWYTTTGWWVPAMVWQAILMLCMSKKTPGVLCTVFDLRTAEQ
jgi:hypothetical protein